MASFLEQLRGMTTVVSDTGDFHAIQQFHPQDATTNPSLIAAAAEKAEYLPIVDSVLKQLRKDLGASASDNDVAAASFRPLEVAFGLKILDIIPGRVSTEVDARLSYDTEKSIAGPARSSASTTRPASPATASSSSSPPHGRAFAPPRSSRRKASTAT